MHPLSLLLLSCLLSLKAYGLSLQDCFKSAKESNPRFQILTLEKKVQSINQAKAFLDLLPSVTLRKDVSIEKDDSVSKAQRKIRNSQKDTLFYARGHLSTSQIATISAKNAEAKLRKYSALSKEQDLLLEGVNLYLDLYSAQQLAGVYQSVVTLAENKFKLVKLKFDLGSATRPQLLNAQADFAKALYEKDKQIDFLNLKTAIFQNFFCVQPTEKIFVSEHNIKGIPASLEELTQLALQKNHNLVASRHEKQLQRSLLAATLTDRTPYLEYQFADKLEHVGKSKKTMDERWQLTLGIPIILGENRSLLDIPIKKHELRKSAIQSFHNMNLVRQEALSHWQEHIVLQKQIKAAGQLVDARALALEGSTQEYKLGKDTLETMYKAEKELKEAKIEQIEAYSKFIKTKYKMLALCGALGEHIDQITTKSHHELQKKPKTSTRISGKENEVSIVRY